MQGWIKKPFIYKGTLLLNPLSGAGMGKDLPSDVLGQAIDDAAVISAR
jgi:hypothetical protein